MVADLLVALGLAAALQPAPVPGFSMTLNGGVFRNHTFTLKPLRATYANTYFHVAQGDMRADRLVLEAETAADGLGLRFDAAPRPGVTAYDRKDEDDPNRNPYMRFDLRATDWALAKGYRFDLVHVDVTITTLEPPGGRIEGTFKGTYELCILPENSGGNCIARTPLTIDGRFSVIRINDRVLQQESPGGANERRE